MQVRSSGEQVGVFRVTTTTAAVFELVISGGGRRVVLVFSDLEGIMKNSVVISGRDCVRDLNRELFTISLLMSSADDKVISVKRMSCHCGQSPFAAMGVFSPIGWVSSSAHIVRVLHFSPLPQVCNNCAEGLKEL